MSIISHVTHIFVHSGIPFLLDIIMILEYYDLCNAPSFNAIFRNCSSYWCEFICSISSWETNRLLTRECRWFCRFDLLLDDFTYDILICLLLWLITRHVLMQVQYMLSPQVVGSRQFDPGQTMSRDKLRTTCRRYARRCLNSCFRVASVRWHNHILISTDAPQRW